MTIPLFIHSRKQLSSTRNFDVCLLKMLDNLNTLSSGPLKTLSQSWLVHAMARGDVARILEPLLITLLDPTTARVSILFCHVRQVASPTLTAGMAGLVTTKFYSADPLQSRIGEKVSSSNTQSMYETLRPFRGFLR